MQGEEVMAGKFPLNGNRPVSTARPSEGIPSERHTVQVSLQIEDRDPDAQVDGRLVQAVTLVVRNDEEDSLVIQASNWTADETGARAIAATLELAAQAIMHKLGEEKPEPKRPHFNPRPAGPRTAHFDDGDR